MPSNPVKLTVTGLSSGAATYAAGYPTWMPDISVRPFNIGIGAIVNSSNVTYNVEHSFDYLGQFSSNFNGWVSSAATWFPNSGITAAASNANGNYAFPVSAIRINVTAGSSTGMVTAYLNQAG